MKDIDSLQLAPPLNIAVAYLDAITRQWAMQFCERAQKYCGDGEIQWGYWKFDVLNDRIILEQAVSSAARANVIVVTAYARTDFTSGVKDWLKRCLPLHTTQNRVLVALLGKSQHPQPSSPAVEFLAQSAEALGIDYYLREFTLQDEVHDWTVEKLSERANTTTGLLSEILSHTNYRFQSSPMVIPEAKLPGSEPMFPTDFSTRLDDDAWGRVCED